MTLPFALTAKTVLARPVMAKFVVEADVNVWPPVQVFACPRAIEPTTLPVVGDIVSVPSLFVTLMTFDAVVLQVEHPIDPVEPL